MSMWQKSKKWVIAAASLLVIALVLWAGIGFVVDMNEVKTLDSRVFKDIVRLNNSTDQQLTAAQAKKIVPILEKLKANRTTNGAGMKAAAEKQADLEHQVYAQLSQEQYNLLLAGPGPEPDGPGMSDSVPGGHGERGGKSERGERGGHGERGAHGPGHHGDAMEAALIDIVIKDLKAKSEN